MITFIYKLLNATVGKFMRVIQTMSLSKNEVSIQEEVRNIANLKAARYVAEHFNRALTFANRKELWQYTSSKALPTDGVVLEFGVYKGESINAFSKLFPNNEIYGFDSFEGLEEDWSGTSLARGHFNVNRRLPIVEKNVELIPGWFDLTLPKFLSRIQKRPIVLLHLDADTYTPTSFVLNHLKENIVSGSIIIFDEFFGYPGFEEHEFKAWLEFSSSNNVSYDYIAYTNSQVAVQIR